MFPLFRMRAGLYYSNDHSFRIIRRRSTLSRRWLWQVGYRVGQTDTFSHLMYFPTLGDARSYLKSLDMQARGME